MFLSNIPGASKDALSKKMSNHIIHDFMVMLYVFAQVATSKELKLKMYKELKDLFEGRMKKHQDYFKKNEVIKSNYQFAKKIIDYFYESCR